MATVIGRNRLYIMEKQRITFFIDGFNLYHAIDDLNKNHLKWLDLSALCQSFIGSHEQSIGSIYYFSAYADWLGKSVLRHKAYTQALSNTGVNVILGNFKNKTVRCKCCNKKFSSHEEKETDVNIALHILKGAFNDDYDKAIIISSDSDFAPAIRMARELCPNKTFSILAPPKRRHSRELINAAGIRKKKKHPSIQEIHLERSLFPEVINLENGKTVNRPAEYKPKS